MRPVNTILTYSFFFCFQTHICSPKACQKSDNQKVVCGSDGLSYPNRCQLERVKCQNKNVTFVKRGPCKRQRSCLEWQDLSLDFPQYRFKARYCFTHRVVLRKFEIGLFLDVKRMVRTNQVSAILKRAIAGV